MGTWIYRKPEAQTIRGLCVICGIKPQRKNSPTTYKPLCRCCSKWRFKKLTVEFVSTNYRKYKTLLCERCGFIPEDVCQLDVHHKDHNHHNNDPNNLETLCANCHRLEHKNIYKTKEAPAIKPGL